MYSFISWIDNTKIHIPCLFSGFPNRTMLPLSAWHRVISHLPYLSSFSTSAFGITSQIKCLHPNPCFVISFQEKSDENVRHIELINPVIKYMQLINFVFSTQLSVKIQHSLVGQAGHCPK